MLETIDLSKSLTREEYIYSLIRNQLQLRQLAYQLYLQQRTLVMLYEGWDAGGKGGNIKRVTEKLDPRGYEVLPIAAPSGEDRTHHYLWRFWRRLKPPDEKQILIFDRSWYGRVMVERLEGFCTEEEWKRAYREINEFERQLVDFGMILAKFWIHISQGEQLRRFEARHAAPHQHSHRAMDDCRG
jgi:polyphosphate kinase 2 (PPK2 family)